MPRSLMKYAVHPSSPVANPPRSSKWRSYMMVIMGIALVIFFCDSLFHSNDPIHTSFTPEIPIIPQMQQITNRNMQQYSSESESDSLEAIIAPIIPKSKLHSKNKEESVNVSFSNTKKSELRKAKLEGNKGLLKFIEENKYIHKDEIQKNDTHKDEDLTMSDYWDFPKQSHIEPGIDATARHRGEYEMHKMRVDWFKREYIDKGKPIAPDSNLITNFSSRCPVYNNNNKCKWKPRMNEICNWTNSAIFWHSMHGTKVGGEFRLAEPRNHWIWDFAKELKESGTCSCPQNVAFVFADNKDKDPGTRLSERSYKFCNDNCQYFRVANNYNPWDWFGKIGPLLDLIDNDQFKNKFEYVVLTDADDQTLVKSPIDIVDKFKFYNASIVIGGEATSYQNWQNQEKGFENAVYPWSRHHQHLNAGGFMGKVVNMIPYLKWMKNDYLNFTRDRAKSIQERGRNFWRDQTVWRTMHLKFYPDIKIDSFAKLWTRTDVFMYDL